MSEADAFPGFTKSDDVAGQLRVVVANGLIKCAHYGIRSIDFPVSLRQTSPAGTRSPSST